MLLLEELLLMAGDFLEPAITNFGLPLDGTEEDDGTTSLVANVEDLQNATSSSQMEQAKENSCKLEEFAYMT